jgi:predicted NUDIX family NTP pyrophosphohydrolase
MKMPKISAGLLMFRRRPSGVEVFLVHPGGPFWQKKDLGAWSIAKGGATKGEDLLLAAQREFQEETGIVPASQFIALGEVRQPGGKIVWAWAFENDLSPKILSNTFSMEWPPGSGRAQEFPEVDRGEWFSVEEARKRINRGQIAFLERLVEALP